ncbi:peptidylprolyl isomerase [Lachnoclostridium sp. Marseille-P6806]|uniref:peptidylprolyl isomerase n=1 Tax=Lachnoclostridium sp. Marseille-P6806 TaxID=2364793 RepID=UPI0035653DA6
MRNWKKTAAAILLVFAAVTGILFFRNGFSIRKETGDTSGFPDAQAMLIITTEANRYRTVYTDQIWQVQVGEEESFQLYLLEQIRTFLKEVKTMNLLADERGIQLTGQEKEQLRQLSSEFYQSLTEADRECIGASEEDVYAMYEAYHRANRLVDEVTKNVDLEISDSEARVMKIQELCLETEESAQEAFQQLSEEGTNFSSVARAIREEGYKEQSVGRGERSAAYETAVFSLEDGQLSQPFADGDSWYLVKCVDSYDEDATLERKERLALQRKNQAFRRIYDTFAGEHPVEIQGSIWENVDLTEMGQSTTVDFFERYQEYMSQKK